MSLNGVSFISCKKQLYMYVRRIRRLSGSCRAINSPPETPRTSRTTWLRKNRHYAERRDPFGHPAQNLIFYTLLLPKKNSTRSFFIYPNQSYSLCDPYLSYPNLILTLTGKQRVKNGVVVR